MKQPSRTNSSQTSDYRVLCPYTLPYKSHWTKCSFKKNAGISQKQPLVSHQSNTDASDSSLMKPASPKVDPLSFKTVHFIPFHQMHTGSHQERRSLCSGSHRDQCGWSSACSWPGSTPTEESQTSVKSIIHNYCNAELYEMCPHQQRTHQRIVR